MKYRIAVIGGGSSGIFAAASLVDTFHNNKDSFPSDCIDVRVYESTRGVLRTIRSSHQDGILHDTTRKPSELIGAGFPRGRKEITSLLTKHFPPLQQQKWFEDRGVQFKTEQGGAMISAADNASDGICDALLQGEMHELIDTKAKITSITRDNQTGGFQIYVGDRTEHCDCIILATGNSHLGHQLASSLGHTIAKPARSCFQFKLMDAPISSYLQEGVRYLLPYVRITYKVKVKGQKRPRIFKCEGPAQLEVCNGTIILSGNAALSLSSFAAFELKDAEYKGCLFAHFCPDHLGGKVEKVEEYLWQHRQDNPQDVVGERCPILHHYVDYDEYDWETESFKTISNECIPSDLWQGLTEACGASYGS
ncbi:hypothetical protein ACHAXR_002160, partial [Thalassiosira sp. AJA248-18]